jgi:hypothetical protein
MGFGLKNTAVLAERRQRERQSVAIKAIVRRLAGDAIVIDIEIISARGFLARAPVAFTKGTMLRVGFPSGRTPHARVVWLEKEKVGCEFLSRVDLHELLTPPTPYPVVMRRRSREDGLSDEHDTDGEQLLLDLDDATQSSGIEADTVYAADCPLPPIDPATWSRPGRSE